jgi:hypothetical protein
MYIGNKYYYKYNSIVFSPLRTQIPVADFSEKKAQQDIKENKEDIIKIFKVVFLLSFISELNYLRGVYKEKTHRILFIEIKIKNNIRRKKKGYYNNNNNG